MSSAATPSALSQSNKRLDDGMRDMLRSIVDGFLKDSDSMGFELFGLGANYNFLPESASLSTSEGLP